MTIYQPGQHLTPLTNQQLLEQLHTTGIVQDARFSEHVTLSSLVLRRPLNILNCEFPYGLTLKDTNVTHEVSFEGCRFAGECLFDRLIITQVLNLVSLYSSGAQFTFNVTVSPSQNADIWIGLQPKTACPILTRGDDVMTELFQQLSTATVFLSYKEIRGDPV